MWVWADNCHRTDRQVVAKATCSSGERDFDDNWLLLFPGAGFTQVVFTLLDKPHDRPVRDRVAWSGGPCDVGSAEAGTDMALGNVDFLRYFLRRL